MQGVVVRRPSKVITSDDGLQTVRSSSRSLPCRGNSNRRGVNLAVALYGYLSENPPKDLSQELETAHV
jgi:hypothetical protein